jgi:hypothetical protein
VDDSEYVVRDNPEELRYEIVRGGELLGEIRYRTEPGAIVLVHTDVARRPKDTGSGPV